MAQPSPRRPGEAMHAVSRVLATALGAGGPQAVAETLVAEARCLLGAREAILLAVAELEGRLDVIAAAPRGSATDGVPALAKTAPVARLLHAGEPVVYPDGAAADAFAGGAGVLLLPMAVRDSVRHVLVVTHTERHELQPDELEGMRALVDAAAVGLAQRPAALARAARTLNETLDLNRVLVRICEEAASILGSDYANVFLGNGREGLRFEATYGLPPDVIGGHIDPGEGLVGKSVERDEPVLTNDHGSSPGQGSLAVPMHWDGELRGVVTVGYFEPVAVTREHLALLEAFADLAAAACRNASAHAGLVLAARTDALTGCLNHAALHDTLRRELERCRRTGHSLSLAIVDLDDFKRINESQGHLAGDEVLRRVGDALRHAVRSYDVVARYGGDEFAIVAIDAGEREAAEVAERAIDGISRAVRRVDRSGGSAGATAGIADWQGEETTTALIARADRALLFGKQRGRRGTAVRASELPADFMPGAAERGPAAEADIEEGIWSDRAGEQAERLRKRTRQLALSSALAARISALSDPAEIVDAAVDELHRGFEYFLCALLRLRDDGRLESVAARGLGLERVEGGRWSQPGEAGLIGRCVRERRPVVSGDVRSEADYRLVPSMADVRSELCVPIWVGEDVWGAIDIEEVQPGAFDKDDVRLIQSAADQIGSVLRSTLRAGQLEQARVATADALAAALDARGGRAPPADALQRRALEVGRRLGMDDVELGLLRLASRFHDVGKLALSDAILHKAGRLSAGERLEVERLPLAAERILARVGFLDAVRGLIRHEHERWDGTGYPGGLSGERIPLTSRVLFATGAYHAMLSDRPYRPALAVASARAELASGSGTQFDPRVVAALLEVLEREDPAQEAVSESSKSRQSRSTLAS